MRYYTKLNLPTILCHHSPIIKSIEVYVLAKRKKRNKQRGEECKSPKKTEQSKLTNFSAYRPNVRRLAFFFLQNFDRNVEF